MSLLTVPAYDVALEIHVCVTGTNADEDAWPQGNKQLVALTDHILHSLGNLNKARETTITGSFHLNSMVIVSLGVKFEP